MTADWLDALPALGWREIVVVVAGIFAAYALLILFRLRRIGRPPPAPVVEAVPPVVAPAPPPAVVEAPPPPPVSSAREVPLDDADRELPWVSATPISEEARRLDLVEAELAALRGEIDGLRASLAGLAEDLRREIADGLATAAAPASPLYGDAMQMAIAGHDAATIAEHCGIARAEAELVVALVRRQDPHSPEREDDGGTSRY